MSPCASSSTTLWCVRAPARADFDSCGAPVQRVFHPVAVHFKGSGFYNTDYGKRKKGGAADGSSGGDSGNSDSSSKESKGSDSKSSDSKSSDSKSSDSKSSDSKTKASSGD